MSVLKKVFWITLFIICISFSYCFAIDENQLNSTTSQQTTTTNIDNAMSINTRK